MGSLRKALIPFLNCKWPLNYYIPTKQSPKAAGMHIVRILGSRSLGGLKDHSNIVILKSMFLP